jgi:hypothetical protein
MKIKCVVACVNAQGEPDFCCVIVECSQEQYELGEHYDRARQAASDGGYENPMLVYDENDGPRWFFGTFDWESGGPSVVRLGEPFETDMERGTCVLQHIGIATLPRDVRVLVEDGCGITDANRFRAAGPDGKLHTGIACATTKKTIVVIEENCEIVDRHDGVQPAWGVDVVDAATPAEAVDGLFCHTVIKVSCCGRNVPARTGKIGA